LLSDSWLDDQARSATISLSLNRFWFAVGAVKNAAAIALFLSVMMGIPAYAQNAQIDTNPSGGVLEIPSNPPVQPDPGLSDSFKDQAVAPDTEGSSAATAPGSESLGASASQPTEGIAENDQNPPLSDPDGAKDPSYEGVNEYLNQQSDYASYASAYSGLPPAALIGPSPFMRYFVFRSMIASSFVYRTPITPIGPAPFTNRPFLAPPIFRYYAPPARPGFSGGSFGGRGFGGGGFGARGGFSHH
jgi:hypothetical protein